MIAEVAWIHADAAAAAARIQLAQLKWWEVIRLRLLRYPYVSCEILWQMDVEEQLALNDWSRGEEWILFPEKHWDPRETKFTVPQGTSHKVICYIAKKRGNFVKRAEIPATLDHWSGATAVNISRVT